MKLLSYGATGSQGFPVARKLLDAGHTVRVLTRDPKRVRGLDGADVFKGDMADADALAAASAGVGGVFLHVPFFTERPGDGLSYAKNAVTAAVEADVKFIVWNASGELPPVRGVNPAFDMRLDVLDIITASGVPYVVFQPTAYMENFLGPWTREEITQKNTFAYPTPLAVKLQWLATEDVGSFVAYAFAHPDLAPLNLKISGPERLNGQEVAERFSRALGREISFRAMPAEEFGEKLEAVFPGMGQGAAQGYAAAYENPELFSSKVDIKAALEQVPVQLTTLEAWVTEHQEAFS